MRQEIRIRVPHKSFLVRVWVRSVSLGQNRDRAMAAVVEADGLERVEEGAAATEYSLPPVRMWK